MTNRLWAALIGIGAGAVLLGAYLAFQSFGGHIAPDLTIVGAAAVVLASAVAVFALTIMERPGYRGARPPLKLNEEPATEYIFPFRGDNVAQIVARPEMPLSMVLARFGNTFQRQPSEMTKDIAVTLRASKRTPFPTITLQQLFLTLKPFRLEHVLLLSDKDQFIGYIPGKRALKEFTADNAAEKITKYVVNVLEKPEGSAVIREIGGAPEADTVKESDDSFYAERLLWANESVNGLVVMRRSRPVGYISKVDVLRLKAGLP